MLNTPCSILMQGEEIRLTAVSKYPCAELAVRRHNRGPVHRLDGHRPWVTVPELEAHRGRLERGEAPHSRIRATADTRDAGPFDDPGPRGQDWKRLPHVDDDARHAARRPVSGLV